jgi:hypothetical protein
VSSVRIIFQLELGPNHEMHDASVDSIGPVIVKNLDVVQILKWGSTWSKIKPSKPLLDYEVHNRAMLLLQPIDVVAVAAQV